MIIIAARLFTKGCALAISGIWGREGGVPHHLIQITKKIMNFSQILAPVCCYCVHPCIVRWKNVGKMPFLLILMNFEPVGTKSECLTAIVSITSVAVIGKSCRSKQTSCLLPMMTCCIAMHANLQYVQVTLLA